MRKHNYFIIFLLDFNDVTGDHYIHSDQSSKKSDYYDP